MSAENAESACDKIFDFCMVKDNLTRKSNNTKARYGHWSKVGSDKHDPITKNALEKKDALEKNDVDMWPLLLDEGDFQHVCMHVTV